MLMLLLVPGRRGTRVEDAAPPLRPPAVVPKRHGPVSADQTAGRSRGAGRTRRTHFPDTPCAD
ncbi:hypothetical protein C5D44_10175 [Rathayibacter sp. AY1B5]|nr:hypothetical protein C5D44_10175 [Rathayibacter sp. AY1B5]